MIIQVELGGRSRKASTDSIMMDVTTNIAFTTVGVNTISTQATQACTERLEQGAELEGDRLSRARLQVDV